MKYEVKDGEVIVKGRGKIIKLGIVGDEKEGEVESEKIIVVRKENDEKGGDMFEIIQRDVLRKKIEVLRRGEKKMI